ncbi:MAG: hypothetical protein HQL17_05595 [Candidatus Omnitrophica bacterium]|nr:hypothetical protein [Candidatus Omnitrophota bacterium]
MRYKLLFPVVLILCVFMAWGGSFAFASSDGFAAARKIETRYFTVQIGPGIDELDLVRTLDISAGDKVLAGLSSDSGKDLSAYSLSDLLDALFLWSSNLLDMQLYSYRGNVKVVANEDMLADIYLKIYGSERTGEKAFYIYDTNTVYVAAPNFTKEIVGHEVAHAIISNYFVVQPSVKVQEVLAGYIEYNLRKKSSRQR